MDRARAAQLLAEHRRRRKAAEQAKTDAAAALETPKRVAALAADLRAIYHPKQRAFFRSLAKLRATTKTRRAGATSGGCRELIARAIELPGFRAVYVTTTRIEARARAWENDTKSGFVDILRMYGRDIPGVALETLDLAGITVQVRQQDMALEFSNGSRLELFGADDKRAINKLRGITKHVFWFDEAQDFQWLERIYKSVVVPARSDFKGECWLTGTPGEDCSGMFWEVTRDDGQPRLKGWEVHAFSLVDNPYFGCVVWRDSEWYVVDHTAAEVGPFATEAEAEAKAIEVRWTGVALDALEENGWTTDDPDFQREYLGKWVKSDARFVYAANAVPLHQLTFAPVRVDADGAPDLAAALADLPEYSNGREYFLVLGADLGTRDDFAEVVWAWSLADDVLYEVCSWKRPGLDYDEMAANLVALREQAYIGLVTADAGGGGKPAVMGWSKKWVERYEIPIVEATKENKEVAIKQLNTDIRKGRIKLRAGGALLGEWLTHRWARVRSATGKKVEDATTANHCADAALYAHRESYHHRHRKPDLKLEPGSSEWVERQEQAMLENALDNAGHGNPFGW
jgi:hypothetical protein